MFTLSANIEIWEQKIKTVDSTFNQGKSDKVLYNDGGHLSVNDQL